MPRRFDIDQLGPTRFDSPLEALRIAWTHDDERVRLDVEIEPGHPAGPAVLVERAGPRERLFFDPSRTTAAFVTCGGLSPGLNNVIRSGFHELTHNYGVARVLGIRNGYLGLDPASGLDPIELDSAFVHDIHQLGGSVLGSSRGAQEPAAVVDCLIERGIDILFCIGGDGTQRGAHAIAEEIRRRDLAKSVIGVPKTIDNDVPYVWTSFGYATALEVASEVVRGAHVEATGVRSGVGLVKVMGRDAGFIATGAALASQDANFVLVPEVPFPLDGFLDALEARLRARDHAVVVVAEGAGQHLLEGADRQRDASGNLLYADIGIFLRDRIREHFAGTDLSLNLRYIDPSYAIRSVPANAWDRILCDRMGRAAVHAAMAGKTDMLIGFWSGTLTHIPIATVTASKKALALDGDAWNAVLSTTGQPHWA
ncbi:MAG: ATP-dependent 6-phosphofructokinase [Myxococcota bacterium]